jgi:predicted alpha/beta hydrolase family esterase
MYFDRSTDTLAIAGTDWGHGPQVLAADLYADLINIPTQTLPKTTRYDRLRDAIDRYKPKRIVAHSLGSAIVGAWMRRNPNADVQAHLYGWPVMHLTEDDKRITSYKGALDPIAMGDIPGKIVGIGHGV